MYLKEILWLISWPAIIALSYLLIRIALKKTEDKIDSDWES